MYQKGNLKDVPFYKEDVENTLNESTILENKLDILKPLKETFQGFFIALR
jgi:hypothetical protein